MKKKNTPTLTDSDFWALLAGLNPENRAENLSARLKALKPAAIAEFDTKFTAAGNKLNDHTLLAALHLIHNGRCSDDLFEYSQYGLLARGKSVYDAALANPDSIATWLKPGEWIADELVGYAASQVYDEMTGKEIPWGGDDDEEDDDDDEVWTGDESLTKSDRQWKKTFPRLHAMFRGPKPAAKAPKTKVKVLEGKSAGVQKTSGKAKAKAK